MYRGTNISNQTFYLHKIVTDTEGDDFYVDHINHNTLDNHLCNLRVIPHDKNSKNRSHRNSNNKTGYRNVFWNNSIQKYTVSLCHNYKEIHIGDFDDVEEAGRAAEDARKRYYGKFAGNN